MKSLIPAFLILLLLSVCSCETISEEESFCLPVNMSITVVQGDQTKKIIADFHYQEDSELLDHITRSDYQTQYFEYDASDRISVLKVMRVDLKVQEELWFVYDGSLVERIDLVTRNLHYTTLEPLDSIYTGYVEYEYEGKDVIEELEYEISRNGRKETYVRNVSYEYDSKGNLLSYITLDPKNGESSHQIMTYDQSKHPYHGLNYYFTGESFENNMLTKSEEDSDFDFTYEIQLNNEEYPETIFERLGSSVTRIIKYSYLCS